MKVTRFILIRHGETTWNREGRIQGHLDSPLNQEGIAQAQALAERLCDESFDALFSSDLGRAWHTAQYVARRTGHAVSTDPRLRERHYGVFQGMTRGQAQHIHPEDYTRYCDEGADYVIPGGESAGRCFAHNRECLEEIGERHRGATVVVVAHGGVLDGFYRHVMGLPRAGPRAFTILNASLNWFSYQNGEWRLERWGEVAHLNIDESLDDV